MAETADQIIGNIQAARVRLGHDLQALETRVRQRTDWRQLFDRRPWASTGVAFGVALLIGIGMGHRRR